MRLLVSIADLTGDEIWQILNSATDLKEEWKGGGNKPLLAGKTLGMVFQEPSLRTRVSFQVGMSHLGGQALYLSPQEIQLGQRESVSDVGRVLSRYVHAIMARVFAHSDVEELAAHASVPVINGLSGYVHPCQALSDLFTIYEKRGSLQGSRLAYVGDGNNVAPFSPFRSQQGRDGDQNSYPFGLRTATGGRERDESVCSGDGRQSNTGH